MRQCTHEELKSIWENAREKSNFYNSIKGLNDWAELTSILGRNRSWHLREQNKYPFHKVLFESMKICEPDNIVNLTMEWGHMAMEDPNRIAYTVNQRKGEDDYQTVTSIGKYLKRNFSKLPDDKIRDFVAKYTGENTFKFVYDLDEMINYVKTGPKSCMTDSDFEEGILCLDQVYRHPYEVYDPRFGWHLAVRIVNGECVGRALCIQDKEVSYFVRSYATSEPGKYSPRDNALESWLSENNYTQEKQYTDAKLSIFKVDDDTFLSPYVDGRAQNGTINSDFIFIDNVGPLNLTDTEGFSCIDNRCCVHCEDSYRMNDFEFIGIDEETPVCQSCLDAYYVYAIGRGGNNYYIKFEDSIEFNNDYYHIEYLSSNEICELENGEYCFFDDSVCVDDNYYHIEDSNIVCTNEGDYRLKTDCWMCTNSEEWYDNNIEFLEEDGKKYHPDSISEEVLG